MARTAPTVNGTPAYSNVSLHFIDASGDKRSVSVQAGPGVTAAEIEAYAENIADASNANLWKIEVSQIYASAPSKASAVEAIYPSVYDNVVVLLKTDMNRSQNVFIPAPNDTIMPPDSDVPDATALALMAVTFINVLEGTGTENYNTVSARFTERREKNQAILI